jgi:sugar phosphate isomerase/epimerase
MNAIPPIMRPQTGACLVRRGYPQHPYHERHTMRIGCNTLYPQGSWTSVADFTVSVTSQVLDTMHRIGYQAVEYSHCGHLTLEEARAIGEHAHASGLQSWSCHAWVVPSELVSPEAPARQLSRFAEVCAALGARVMVVHAPLQLGLKLDARCSVADLMAFDLAALRPAQRRAEDLGVELALENGRDLEHLHYVLELLEALGAANAGICVDTGHANLGALGAARAVRMAGDKLFTTHLHDNLSQGDDHLPPGQGHIEWLAVFEALRAVGYARPLMLELSDRDCDPLDDHVLELQQGLANTLRFAAQSGLALT